MPRIRTAVGRHDVARVPSPAAGYAAMPSSPNNSPASIAIVAVADPYDGQLRLRALARVDLLDRERRAGRIDEASFRIGREVEDVLAPMRGIGGGGQWLEGDRVDAATSAELAAVLGVQRAMTVNTFLGWMLRRVGVPDTRLLWLVLGEGYPLSAAATRFGRGDDQRGRYYIADRFRDALATLAQAKAARGRGVR